MKPLKLVGGSFAIAAGLAIVATVMNVAMSQPSQPNWYQQQINKALVTAKAHQRAPVPSFPFDLPVDDPSVEDALAKAGRTNGEGALDYDTFALPVVNGRTSREGYPIFAFECDGTPTRCYGPTGEPLGTLDEVLAKLPMVRNRDTLLPGWTCHQICVDADHHIVGAMSPAMIAYLAHHRE